MTEKQIQLNKKQADGFCIPLGVVNLVCIKTDVGLVGCGGFNAPALDNFNYPTAIVKKDSGPIETIEDILIAKVTIANESAAKLGLKTGITGKEALELL